MAYTKIRNANNGQNNYGMGWGGNGVSNRIINKNTENGIWLGKWLMFLHKPVSGFSSRAIRDVLYFNRLRKK